MNKWMPDSQNRDAAALMLAATVGFSLTPLFIAWSGGGSPFFFAAAWAGGLIACCAVILFVFYRPLVFDASAWKAVRRRMFSWYMLGWLGSYFAISLYALSTQFVDVAISAALYETWPIIFVALAMWFFRDEGRYRKITSSTVLLFAVAFVGVASVFASQAGGPNIFRAAASAPFLTLGVGVVLGVSGASLAALGGACGLKWSSNLGADLAKEGAGGRDKGSLELFGAVIGSAICNSPIPVITALAGIGGGESLSLAPIAFGAAGGALIGAGTTVVWRKANLTARNLDINLMRYASPALAVLWLSLFSLVGDIDGATLWIGVILIFLANAGLYFDLEPDPIRLSDERVSATPKIYLDALAAERLRVQALEADARRRERAQA